MPLIPLLLGLAPTVASWIFGDKTGGAVNTVTEIARQVIGTDDPDAIEKAVSADPNLALQFKMAVLKAEADARNAQLDAEKASRQAEIDELKTIVADVQSARAQTVSLAQAKSPIAYGVVVMSVLSMMLAGAVAYLALFGGENAAKWTETIITMLVGAAIQWVAVVQSYWLGSSRGSADKDSALAQVVRGTGKG